MLVLTRKHDEKIHIGGNITVTVLRVQGNRISLGFEAPKNVRVLRGELQCTDAGGDRTDDRGGLSKRAAIIVARLANTDRNSRNHLCELV